MNILTVTLTLLLGFNACKALTCFDKDHTFYYADVSTGCQVYHFCENFALKTLNCPSGQAFDHRTSKCETASTVTCYEILMQSTSQQNNEHRRSKRQAPVHDFLYSFASPLMKPAVKFMAESLFGNENTLKTKVILPVVYEMVDNPLSRRDLFTLFFSVKSAFGPLILEMFRHQTFNAPEGTIIKVPREYYDRAVFKFVTETKPILKRLAMRHLSGAFKRAAENVPAILESIKRLKAAKYPYAGDLKDSVIKFVMKHGILFKTSSDTHLNFYSMPEIMNDLMPIKISLFKIMMEYIRQNPNSLLNLFFGESSLFQNQFMGIPVIARPLQRTVKPVKKPRNLRGMVRRYRG